MSSRSGADDPETNVNGESRSATSADVTPESHDFDQLIEDFSVVWCRLHPVASVDVGVYDYADRLRPYADDDHAVLVSLNERLLKGLEEIDPSRLDPDRAMDYELAFGGAYLELDALKRHDWRHRDPQRFVPIDAIYQLLVRPVPHRFAALAARLQALPDYLRQSTAMLRQHADEVSPDWLDNALQSLQSGRQFIAAASDHPQVLQSLGDDPVMVDRDSKRLMFLLAGANDALAEFEQFLGDSIAPHAKGEFATGEDRFNALLKYRHFLSVDCVGLRKFGETVIKQTQADLKRVALSLSGSDDALALIDRIRGDVINTAGLLPAYRQAVDSARRFVVDKALVTIPLEAPVSIEVTPEHLRYFVPFSDYIAPSPNDPQAQATYLVTPVDDSESIIGHDHRRIRHLTVSDTWPGKHLQSVVTQHHPAAHTIIRLLNASSTCTRGWALYSEELMVREGFINGPEDEFLLLYNRLWRALGLVADIDLHTRARTATDVEQELIEKLRFTPGQAKAEVARYTRQATVTMGYVCGSAQIREAWSSLVSSTSTDISQKTFHDKYLRTGPVAVSLALERAFGGDVRQGVDETLFGV